jgi:CO/xanthine dehydrogenase Mo-binding subunit
MSGLDRLTKTSGFKVVGTRPIRPDGIEKVTGRARFGADAVLPGMLVGLVLRSPHPHARIKSIDTSKAEALQGVKAVITSADFGEVSPQNRNRLHNVMAHEKALYEGHAIAALAATDKAIAKQALRLIEVAYEILPHVTDVEDSIRPDAPLVDESLLTGGINPKPTKPSNIALRSEFGHGDLEAGFARADVVIERTFKTEAAHQGYIEPHACLASCNSDGSAELWCCTQGHFLVRDTCADLLGIDVSRLRVTASEIGGGFGGKTVVYLEPLALALSRKAGRPVKMTMTRAEVFKATGPTASSYVRVKIGATKDGRITAADAELYYQTGAFPEVFAQLGAMCAFACYRLENVRAVGYEVLANRPMCAAYRAPGAPIAAFAVESVVDEIARAIEMDPLEFRLKNAAKKGDRSSYGPVYPEIGLVKALEGAKAHPHYSAPLAEGAGRGVAAGFWFNFGGLTCVSLNVNIDGTVTLSVGRPDIGGSRAAMCQMAAEELGIPYENVRTIIADTSSLGFNDTTDGSRTTFANGIAIIEAARSAIRDMCGRAARLWGIPEDAVHWEEGAVRPAGPNAGDFEPMTIADLARTADKTGGPIAGHHEINAEGAGVSFSVHIADVEVDQETGWISVSRYTVVQDAGKAIHPDYVEGQYQGGAVQGIGWAINEGYCYGEDGKLQNPGFLDYRIPVASDLPMIDAKIIEIPNRGHPYGVRGVGETAIVPPLATIGNAVRSATGVRVDEVPMAPPVVLQAIEKAKGMG